MGSRFKAAASGLLAVVFVLGVLVFTPGTSMAASADELARQIDSLKDRLIDLQTQLNELRSETKKNTEVVEKVGKAGAVPKWVQSWAFKGDFRLRYQQEQSTREVQGGNDIGDDTRTRWRIRLRPGVEAKINDKLKAGFGLATGGVDPRSTNETLDDNFQTDTIMLDLAYATYTPLPAVSLTGGKMKNPLWQPKDLLWDGDITPEGLAAQIKFKPMDNLEVFLTPVYFFIQEQRRDFADPTTAKILRASEEDPYLAAIQAGIKYGKDLTIKAAVSKYAFGHIKDTPALASWNGDNTLENVGGNATGTYKYDYDILAFDVEVGFKTPIELVPYVAVFGTSINNPDPEDDNNGYLYGFKFGHAKIADFGQWQFKYNYRHLETDAWLDMYTDSDARGGSNNTKGSEFEFTFGLAKNWTVGLDYYSMKTINAINAAGDHISEKLLQLDLVWKF